MTEEFTAADELHDEVDSDWALENVFHVDKEGVVHGAQDISFEVNVVHLIVLQDSVFTDALHRVLLIRIVLVLDEVDLAESAFTKHSDLPKIWELNLVLRPRKNRFSFHDLVICRLSVIWTSCEDTFSHNRGFEVIFFYSRELFL